MTRWGLVPYWAKDLKIGFSTINATAETVDTKPVFREAFRRRRCLVPVNNFCEWKKLNEKTKQILAPDAWPVWLGEKTPDSEWLKGMLRPYPAESMTMWPVVSGSATSRTTIRF